MATVSWVTRRRWRTLESVDAACTSCCWEFSPGDANLSSCCAGKPPIYIQHQGHSRTLIGVERIQLHEGHAAEVSLLLLDPGLRLPDLITALRQKSGWQACRSPALFFWV